MGRPPLYRKVNSLNPIQRDQPWESEPIIALLQTGTESPADETQTGQQGCWQTKQLTDETHEQFSTSG